MLNLYKIEAFTRSFVCRDFALVTSMGIEDDFLSIAKSTVECTNITVQKGDYIVISKMDGDVLYQGILDEIEPSDTLKLTLKPLYSIFDTNFYWEYTTTGVVENDIKAIIQALFQFNDDAQQLITGITITTPTGTSGNITPQSNISSLYELLKTALTSYGVMTKCTLNTQLHTFNIEIGKVSGTVDVEADLKQVIDKSFVIGSTYGSTNKETIINSEDTTERANFYLHSDGTITSTDTDRILPVIFDFKEIQVAEGETFATKALEQATADLSSTKYNNSIEITVPTESKVVNTSMPLGQEVRVHHNGETYKSLLTGRRIEGQKVTLIFGCIRISLTQQLNLERRK